ncbi:cyclase family protein [Serratia sp. P2ACOL2]|uniref:cyclase family protein n=1 Tax=Serratia sp. P2ACOL2 TaxID=2482769 RepID=UPI000EFBB771|nr:cyclase family protein [Serratia sp. P2ACOL2]AYO37641.1 cyclase family protein [Serratia sp. P2ACOL2]
MSLSLIQSIIKSFKSNDIRIVDLTHQLNSSFPALSLPPEYGQTWAFKKENISSYDENGPAWYWNNFSCGEHTGTHFDAPAHWISGRERENNTVDTIDVSNFIGEAVVIDAVEEVRQNSNWVLTKGFLLEWEKKHGQIPDNAWVLFQSGWSERINDPEKFANLIDGKPHTPGPDQACVQWMIEERNVRGFGVETINIDAGLSYGWPIAYPCHNLMLGSGRFGLQCLNNLSELPARDIIIVSAPLKIEDGSGSPLRVLAIY